MINFLFASVTTVSILALISSVILLALAAFEFINPSFRFWPPPADQLWKKRTFMMLFRGVVYGLIFTSVLHFWEFGLPTLAAANLLAIFLIICGFAIGFFATGALGWENAFGSKEGLKTEGIFNYSRNPIYIATWFGLAGWALLIRVPIIVATLMCWALLYVFAIFIEERWLAKEYSEPFREYCRNFRRFF